MSVQLSLRKLGSWFTSTWIIGMVKSSISCRSIHRAFLRENNSYSLHKIKSYHGILIVNLAYRKIEANDHPT